MAFDFENSDSVAGLSDDELRRLVRDRLDAERALDPEDVTVAVRDGVVTLSGRVGTEGEVRIADHLLSDGLGLERYENHLVVDPIRRAESPEAIDEHLADEEQHEGLLLGDRAAPLSPEAEHLEEDVSAHLFGTANVHEAIERAAPWVPPEGPTPEGTTGTDA
jgi:hypothetical protein